MTNIHKRSPWSGFIVKKENRCSHWKDNYVKQKVLAGGTMSFECKERRNGNCKAKVKVLDGELVGRINEHS